MEPWDQPVSAKEATAARLRGLHRFYPDFLIELDPSHGHRGEFSVAQLEDLIVQIRRRLGPVGHLEVDLEGEIIRLFRNGDPIWSTSMPSVVRWNV